MTAADTIEGLTAEVQRLTAELADAERKITRLQEEADRGEMFQSVSTEWRTRYLTALETLSKARTQASDLARRLKEAQRIERAARVQRERRAALEQEIDEAGAIG